jgi:hypothetical protein
VLWRSCKLQLLFLFDLILYHIIDGNAPDELMKATVTILNNSDCSQQYPNGFKLNSMLCASAPGKDTCYVGHHTNIIEFQILGFFISFNSTDRHNRLMSADESSVF